ncbi:hypothetical protein HK101_004417 [Irineochytrium annulatum]|nr:hypothetical protein HK101_004417 [Irineochytrium annulatum]
MVAFNILCLVIDAWLIQSIHKRENRFGLRLWYDRILLPRSFYDGFVAFVVVVFVAGHIGAPFIATTVVKSLDWGNACYGSELALGTDGGGIVTLGSRTVGQSTLTDVDASHIVASFKADAAALRSSSNAALWNSGTGLVDVEIVLDRGGNGNITGSCVPVGADASNATPAPCMAGLLTARIGKTLSGWFAPISNGSIGFTRNRTLINLGFTDWWDNPVDVTGGPDTTPSVVLANTAARPFSDEVKVCSDRVDVAFVMMAVVNQLQGRASGCNDCWTQCTTCCTKNCYQVASTSTSCDSKGKCTSTTTYRTQCDCVRCSNWQCRSNCFNSCKGIGMPS